METETETEKGMEMEWRYGSGEGDEARRHVLYISGDRLHSAQGEADFGNPNMSHRLD